MSDFRRIEVEKTVRASFVVDVEAWFTEFADEWADFEQDAEGREEFIKETAYELASEDSLHLNALETLDETDEFEVSIVKDKTR